MKIFKERVLADELNDRFFQTIKTMFAHQEIELTVREVNGHQGQLWQALEKVTQQHVQTFAAFQKTTSWLGYARL